MENETDVQDLRDEIDRLRAEWLVLVHSIVDLCSAGAENATTAAAAEAVTATMKSALARWAALPVHLQVELADVTLALR